MFELYTKKLFFISAICIVVLLFSGCARLRWLDDRLGEGFSKIENASFEEILGSEIEQPEDAGKLGITASGTIVELIEKLTPEQKEKIENWLIENALNRYGDPEETDYAGGTPLFNEATGESIERYFYILNKHQELLNNL